MAFVQYLRNKFQTVVPALTTGQSWPTVIDTTGALSINQEGRKATYRAASQGTPIAGAVGYPFFSLAGSNTKVVRVTRVKFIGTAATGAEISVLLMRYTNLTGGTGSVVVPPAPLDITNPPPTAVATSWSVAGSVSPFSPPVLAADVYEMVTTSVSVVPQIVEWTFGNLPSQALVLRGALDIIGVNLPVVGTTPVGRAWVEWTEE